MIRNATVERRQLRSVADALPTRMTADLSVALAFFAAWQRVNGRLTLRFPLP